MWNIIRSQLYQLKRDIIAWGVLLVALIVTFLMNIESFEAGSTGSEATALMGQSMSSMAGFLVIMTIVANIMGKDFLDKTLNYEVLSGHTRKDVFFGRLIAAIIVGVLCTFLVIISVPVTATILNGWGNTMELKGVLIRFCLVLVTLFRIACEVAFVTILAKNPYVTYLVSVVLGELQIFVSLAQAEFTEFEVTPLLPVANCLNLLTFQDWATFYLDETDQIIYSSAVTTELALWALIPSIAIGAVMIILSYVFFKHDDLN